MMTALRTRNPKTVGKALLRSGRKPLRLLKTPFRYIYQKTNLPLRNFQPKFHVHYENENFILKTANSPFELRQVLKLRHDIFYTELQGKVTASRLDFDEFDMTCDHLIIIDKASSKVVGTYRLISSLFSDKFYSAGEFDIATMLALPGNKLELGRACIHPDFRNGSIINLLWRGIVEYIKKTDAKYLFGCASVQTVDPLMASGILEYLRAGGLSLDTLGVAPTEKYRSHLVPVPVTPEFEKEIPALIHSYIKAGAKFYGAPAFDRDFDCYDFFMMLKIEDMNKLFRRRFGLDK